MLSKSEILRGNKVSAQFRIAEAQRDLAELSKERRNALDLDDLPLFKAIVKEIHERNMTILNNRAVIKEIDAQLAAISA